jgi:2-methylisocitrate lyase-like PEP mutase family enzyme
MERACGTSEKPMLANMLEGGKTPILPPPELSKIGYKLAAYPLTLLNASVRAMQGALAAISRGETPTDLLSFREIRRIVGFDAYDAEAARYAP